MSRRDQVSANSEHGTTDESTLQGGATPTPVVPVPEQPLEENDQPPTPPERDRAPSVGSLSDELLVAWVNRAVERRVDDELDLFRTEVASKMEEVKDELRKSLVPRHFYDRQSEDFRTLTSMVVGIRDRLAVIEGKVDLLMANRDHETGTRKSSPAPRDTNGRRSQRRSNIPLQIRSQPAGPEDDGGDPQDADRVSEMGSDGLPSDDDRLYYKEPKEEGFVPRSVRPWKGPRVEGLKELRPSDPRFTDVLSYRRYRLLNTSSYRGSQVQREVGVYSRRMSHVMQKLIFDGRTPIAILRFLSTFKKELDRNGLSEGSAVMLCPKFLDGEALELYDDQFDDSADGLGGFYNWPGAVNFLLQTYAKDAYIEDALKELDECKQEPQEDELSFARKLQKQARTIAGVFSTQDLCTRFLRGANEAIKPLLRHQRHSFTGPQAFNEFVEYAHAQGSSSRAVMKAKPRTITQAIPTRKLTNPHSSRATTRAHPNTGSYLVESHYDDGRTLFPKTSSDGAVDRVNVVGRAVEEAETPTEGTEYSLQGLPRSDTESFQTARDDVAEIDAVGSFRPRKKEVHPQATRYRAPQPGATSQQIKWNDQLQRAPADICFECFELGHRKPDCPYNAAKYDESFHRKVAQSYYKLTQAQREWLHRCDRTPLFALQDMLGSGVKPAAQEPKHHGDGQKTNKNQEN